MPINTVLYLDPDMLPEKPLVKEADSVVCGDIRLGAIHSVRAEGDRVRIEIMWNGKVTEVATQWRG